ncbi:hypothetical protein ASPZODRAFT_59331 [Penicilliopsis zonata CBS 506.65]|uniref:Uncharacterized protein n=1 Tax=Penicilliopsis zonata CBS 506.65 TaxID=1073090 RepID=A0A1L9SR69_9EURO|nr:hypothetical protein ASPZODRAFT_59331 [Penicilliopsis zonata CBS 506.65]OJJ49581.1 hypothetical protein ASPZODRAFT_59331 [Penicilliopsis zonata CBS 506.65]
MTSRPKADQLRKVSSQRLPPPALFQGPPSHNASNLSLAPPPTGGVPTGTQAPPLQRNSSARRLGSIDSQIPLSPFLTRTQSKGEADGSDAVWQEMQNALAEVELSAVTSEHVFGEKHSEALEDLRMRQLRLAQAWARSEAEDEVVDSKSTTDHNKQSSVKKGSQSAAGGTTDRAGMESASHRTLDEETEKDILLARERREANDRYFNRVNNGVLDVVAKLEEVAQAMRIVERESKDIWSDSDSIGTAPSTNTS